MGLVVFVVTKVMRDLRDFVQAESVQHLMRLLVDGRKCLLVGHLPDVIFLQFCLRMEMQQRL